MEKNKFDRMMKTVPGVGVTVKNRFGEKVYYFYEDFEDDPGIDRAMDQMYAALYEGKIKSVAFHASNAFDLDRAAQLWAVPVRARTQQNRKEVIT